MAAPRFVLSSALAILAIARPSPCIDAAWFGAEHPSMPQPADVSSVNSSNTCLIATCNGWSISTYSGPQPLAFTIVRNPQCLPLQLL